MSLPEQSNEKSGVQASELPARPLKKPFLSVREMTVFAMLGAILFCSKLLMEWAPNIHFIALFIISFTLVYRKKALVPIYLFVLLTGVYGGFNVWWVPYLYIWLPLWGITMLLPRRMPRAVAIPVFVLLGALHGALYGILYAPAQALFFKMDFRMTVAWVLSGMLFDLLHAVGNAAACLLTLPLVRLLCKLEKKEMLF